MNGNMQKYGKNSMMGIELFMKECMYPLLVKIAVIIKVTGSFRLL
jgi:hypothetical protein